MINRPLHPHKLSFSRLRAWERPGRYLGPELFTRSSNHKGAHFEFVLLFPDLYEIGASYYGYQLLYHIINQIPKVRCERAFLPWKDAQQEMVRKGTLLISRESGRPLREFDAVGITLQTELHYPGVYRALVLGGITPEAKERSSSEPLVIGGGPCAFHPEPVAPLFDAIVLGDGEEVVVELIERCIQLKVMKADRREIWQELSLIPGIYVPPLYEPSSEEWGEVVPTMDRLPSKVQARVIDRLRPEDYPLPPVIPAVSPEHDRLTVEIMRGCTQGCRFCQAGMIQRPVRERSVEEIMELVKEGLRWTGYSEVGLLSLSSSDYSHIGLLLNQLVELLTPFGVKLAFPSLRPASFTPEVARLGTTEGRGRVTFAVESGSERLRRVINKNVKDEEIFRALEVAREYKWRGVKLYFMLGLPTESDDDIEASLTLLNNIVKMTHNRPSLDLHLSFATFIPKPHTVFEGEAFIGVEEAERRFNKMREGLKSPSRKETGVKIALHPPHQSMVETILARGDRRLVKVIREVAMRGWGFEAWGGEFLWELWREALDRWYPEWKERLGPIPFSKGRPWDHLSKGISPKFMREEIKRAYEEVITPDCRWAECSFCGIMKVCPQYFDQKKSQGLHQTELPVGTREMTLGLSRNAEQGLRTGNVGSMPYPQKAGGEHYCYRLYITKLLSARALGHRDYTRLVVMALRRSGLPLVLTQGFIPHMKLTLGPALPLGVGAYETWVDIYTYRSLEDDDFPHKVLYHLRTLFPKGIKPLRIERLMAGDSKAPISSLWKLRLGIKEALEVIRPRFNGGRAVRIDETKGTIYIQLPSEASILNEIKGCEDNISQITLVRASLGVESTIPGPGYKGGQLRQTDRDSPACLNLLRTS